MKPGNVGTFLCTFTPRDHEARRLLGGRLASLVGRELIDDVWIVIAMGPASRLVDLLRDTGARHWGLLVFEISRGTDYCDMSYRWDASDMLAEAVGRFRRGLGGRP